MSIFLLVTTHSAYGQQPLLHRANLSHKEEKYDEAIACYQEYLTHNPQHTTALSNYAYCCIMIGRMADAITAYHAILQLNPHNEQILYNTAYALKTADRMDEALRFYDAVLSLNPASDQALFGKARTLITMGDFARGWPLYRKYLEKSGKKIEPLYSWIHSNQLHGKIIVLIPEGSYGDTFQFIRYAQTLKEMGATVIAMVHKKLLPLLSRCPYIDTLLSTDDRIPPHHAYATTMNMPALCNSDDATIPRTIPYIFPDPERIAYWRAQLAHDTSFKIGVCWQADVHNDVSRPPIGRRGIPLSTLYDLAQIPGVSLYSLQQYDGLEQLADLPAYFNIKLFDTDFDTTHGAFMDTAAVMTQLDLVITVDTSIAHLAGALGVPTYVILPYQTDWRWITGRSDTPWYHAMRIFKQQTPFDYEGVAHMVIEAVRTLTKEHA